ncbi:unnamed protein product [Nippostrongylus brasiliensis]|uniref:Short-chain dehydrogenase n=1 Tax=Nippostrongylus brasiliensis TaxID=27835 RepID=A0A0N4Y0Z9_NIPBR|nr:unnamed protein product [Nippostrongylus brasiliensis]
MQNFHECISHKLNAENAVGPTSTSAGDDEVGDVIASVLAPYRDEPGWYHIEEF